MKLGKILLIILVALFLCLLLILVKNIPAKLLFDKNATGNNSEYLESYYNNPFDYKQAFSGLENQSKQKVLAVTTSHHFLAKTLIAKTYAGIDPSDISTVIIVSPDHYLQIQSPKTLAETTGSFWKTPFGTLTPDQSLIYNLNKFLNIPIDTNLFRREHGIFVEIPFIKKVFPDVKVVPLVLKQSNDYKSFYELGQKVSQLIDLKKTLLVISSDFSHDVSSKSAEIADAKSINFLPGKKLSDVKQISNDCLQCTAFLFGYLKNTDTNFKLIFNTNSFDISGQDPGNVTSYVGSYYFLQ